MAVTTTTGGGTATAPGKQPDKRMQQLCKRAMDIALAGTALLIFAPVMAIIAVIIRLTSRGPALYRWPVVGTDGQPFRAYKFRTMVIDADRLKQSLQKFNEASGPVFKMKNDPRITPIGRFLRKFSLDELPQLWSIVKGDMSVVGPRPVLITEWEQFSDFQRLKLRGIKPGALSLWHVSGQPRNLDEWVRLDLQYAGNWSLLLDCRIVAQAGLYILSGRNC